MTMETSNICEPWISRTPDDISKAEALAELAAYEPDAQWHIQQILANSLEPARVRIWQNDRKMTVRPSLREAMGVARWWYVEKLGRNLPESARISN